MAAPKLVKLGIKRKEMFPTSPSPVEGGKSEKDYDNEVVYPELDVSGPLAEQLGAEDLSLDEEFTQTVKWRVKRQRVSKENGKKDFGLTLCMIAASNIDEAPTKAKKDDDDDSGDSPAMEYITGRAANAAAD